MTRLWNFSRRPPSPLRRRSDRIQARVGRALSVAVLTLAPLSAALVGGTVHDSLRKTAEEQTRTGHRTTAVLLRDAPRHLEPGSEEAQHVRYPVKVRFVAPDGTPSTGTAHAHPGAVADSTVQVWSDATGTITEPPLDSGEIRLRAVSWAAGAGGAVVLSGVVIHTVFGRFLDRHRMQEWERAWSAVAPGWTPPT
ncbi:Rv1733c family protein [Streptomyces cavernicola]|uniref:Proline rich protein membrane protein n=1 Tax=Streptomyces cavernicola TaxID=3043613 RepID=A0ABT6SNG3_9ACTN|nr:hypothetical protein [Streptomyces sp. B-S-A6]MDI3408968.1 hypothetical protein [Streptomyces sp. B-S-A6]